ncbi:MAG: redox-regulated ATPase YchF [Anaerolineae bacterium]
MQIGIIGLPTSGKTTIFNALTRGTAPVEAFSSGKLEIHTASIGVPDARIDILTGMYKPRKTIHAQVQYNDIGGLARGIGEKGGLDGSLLNQIVQNDALVMVVRAFEDANIPHLDGSVNPARDLENLNTELILSDLGVVERRIERVKTSITKGGGTPADREGFKQELALLERFRETLENGKVLRDLDVSATELKPVRGMALTTIKPTLVVLNAGEQTVDPSKLVGYDHQKTILVTLQGKLEMELAQMSETEAKEFLAEFGIQEPSLPRMIRLSYNLLGMHAFFTVGEDEVRAWTIPVGATAVEAAGTIHTDLARGFIRAEVIAYTDLIAAGSMAEAKKRGTLRLEGKEYLVKDGDILNIRFSI